MTSKLSCQRCGLDTERLYEISTKNEDEYGDEKEDIMKVCWDCDFDIMNGGDIHEDVVTVLQTRAENNYEYDPINEVRPY